MIRNLFLALTHAVEGTPALALLASFVWGVLSIILSPCHLASIPLIVGFIGEQGTISTGRAFRLATLFSVGILITIALIGMVTALLGRMAGDIGSWGNYLVAGVFFLVGLHLLEIITLPMMKGANQPGLKRKGLLASFILGLVFGVALGPCTFAYMAPMLAVTFRIAADRFLYGVSLLLAYGIGHCSVIIFAGTFTEAVEHYLHWNEKSKGVSVLKKICGILVILGGAYMLWIT